MTLQSISNVHRDIYYTYARVSFLDKLEIFLTLLRLPVALVTRLVLSPFRVHDKNRSWNRVTSDETFRFFSSQLRVNQMQYIMGTTPTVYAAWAKKNARPAIIDDLGNDGVLMWFTDKRVSGNLSVQDYVPPFWISIISEIKMRTGKDYGFVALSYSLYPSASFPTQLLQAISGLSCFLPRGTKLEDIHLVGDSAGAALVLQVLSHLLHPHLDIPQVPLLRHLGGALLMSPRASLRTEAPSFTANSDSDVLPGESWAYLASGILNELEGEGRLYLGAVKLPSGWWDGVDKVVKKITIHTGALECLRDDAVTLARILKQSHRDVKLFVQPGGVRTDPYLTHLSRENDDEAVVDLLLERSRINATKV
ncbi:alpha/beta-hydrolase [Macrolepiota fuliginosa MF-IS2]|uniref:Alpha/beta-hydrolase n=1 Tax=Macrolepiota fuliginosa MF-IS2 TaxID=1400762 RepID=A0A9P5XDI0_9AGAR|nr:alpha/beta-hydrolase [Macrolepiota fuliginosa MF-IS2]